jgi:hypothetical protein
MLPYVLVLPSQIFADKACFFTHYQNTVFLKEPHSILITLQVVQEKVLVERL